jgi:hypothetical protein
MSETKLGQCFRGAGGSSLPKISHGSNGSASALYSSQSLDTTDSQMIQQPRGENNFGMTVYLDLCMC